MTSGIYCNHGTVQFMWSYSARAITIHLRFSGALEILVARLLVARLTAEG